MTTAALVHEHELKAQHSAHAANIALLLRTPAEGAAALRNQMVQIDTQLMRISCAQEV